VGVRGGTISNLRDDGTQEWTTLGTLLDSQEAHAALGDDRIFVLKGLLTKDGRNIRNDVAHGFLDDAEFHTADMVYLWWLTLHLCLITAVACEKAIAGEPET
jgi:hypothetical protein